MSWSVAVASLRREVFRAIGTAIAQIVVVSQFGKSSEIGNDDAVESADENDPGKQQRGQRPVVRVQPWGVSGRPTSKVRGVSLRFGSGRALFIGILPTEGYGPQDLEDGETAIYSAEVERALHATSAGATRLAAKTGQTVQVNGDTYAMPQWDAYMTALKIFVGAVKGAANIAAVNAAATTFETAINTGNAGAAAVDFKSSKAKNG